MSKVLYVSGKMAGLEDYGLATFADATRRLRAAGYYVINPSENWGCPGPGVIPRSICMKMDLQQVLMAEGIATLSDWQDSPGARLEVEVATSCDIPVLSADVWVEAAEVHSSRYNRSWETDGATD